MSNPKNIIFTPSAIAATSRLGLMPLLNRRNLPIPGSTAMISGVHVRKVGGPLTSPHRNHVRWPNSGGGSKPSTADPAPKCNNQPQQPSLVVTNEWTMHTIIQTKQQSNKEQFLINEERWGICKFVACLVFISFYSYNTYLAFKLMQQLDCVIN
jgi:hypothetical protein